MKKKRKHIEDVWNIEKIKTITDHVINGNDMAVIIDLHLRIEHTIDELLLFNATNPDFLDVNSINFSNKLRIATAFGLIAPKLHDAVAHINTIRNRAAHNLDYNVTEEDADKMFMAINSYFDYSSENIADDRAKWVGKHTLRFFQYALLTGGMIAGGIDAKISQDI